jgi:hypothetical protein
MKQIGLFGGGFQHSHSTTLWKKPSYFEWSKNKLEDITFFVDDAISYGLNQNCKIKIGWLVESRGVISNAIDYVKNNWMLISQNYDILITHDKSIYDLADNFYYLPPHGYWVDEPKIHNKTKLVSMISSNKSFLDGHKKRLEWVNKLKKNVDLFGNGFKTIEKKEEALNDYMFSVTIENDKYETYWSEKILDCFATGTVPVYYGSPDIGDYFNIDGIIMLTNDFDINSLNFDEYNKRKYAIEDNYKRVLKYDIIEDIIYNKWIKLQ